FKFCPVAVIPVQPVSHFAVYAVACIVLVWPPDLDDTFDGDCFVFLSFGFDFVLTETILFFGFFFFFLLFFYVYFLVFLFYSLYFVTSESILFLVLFNTSLSTSFLSTSLPFSKTNS